MGSDRERLRLGQELARMEREDREVAAAAASYERMSRRLRDQAGSLPPDTLARIYDLSVPVEELSVSPDGKSFHGSDPAPGLAAGTEREIDSPAR